jgi:heme-degrading monooxygenase HmoA
VIARIWKATAQASRIQDYVLHFTEQVARTLATVPGYRGAQVLCAPESDPAELVVVTWWSSREAIQAFAGADIGRAVVASDIRPMFVSWDETVTHYSVLAEHAPPSGGRPLAAREPDA